MSTNDVYTSLNCYFTKILKLCSLNKNGVTNCACNVGAGVDAIITVMIQVILFTLIAV